MVLHYLLPLLELLQLYLKEVQQLTLDLKSPSIYTWTQHVISPLKVILPNSYVKLNWYFGTRHRCSIDTHSRQSIVQWRIFVRIHDHLEEWYSVSVETFIKSFQSFQEAPVDRLYQHASSVLLFGSMFNLSLSISIYVSFPNNVSKWSSTTTGIR